MKNDIISIELNNEEVTCKIKRKSIKNVYFKWQGDILAVSCPNRYTDHGVKKLLQENKDGIIKLRMRTPKSTLKENEMYYLGDKYKIIYDGKSSVHFRGDEIISKDDKELNKFLQNECINIFTNRINSLKKQFDDLPEFKLRIRKMKTRWGVCNKGSWSVTLNSDLIKKDVTLIDYVIIHELCHFKHMNHSKEFWNEVEKYYPYHKLARKRLRESQYD